MTRTGRQAAVGAFMLLFVLMAGSPVFAGDAMSDAMEQYGYKRYHAASQLFEKAVMQDPHNVKAHYYLGVCYETLKDPESARQEYDIAFRLNPFSDEGHSAREALLHLATTVGESKHQADSPKEFAQAVRQINGQAADNAQRWVDWGNQKANYRIGLGNIEAGMKQREAQWALHFLRGTPYAHDISSRYLIDSSYQLTDSQVQANRYRQDGTNAARFTYESANSLKSLLSEAPKKDSFAPRLRALGTNLYVRNYGDYDDDIAPADPPLELRAKEKSFADLPAELRATPGRL